MGTHCLNITNGDSAANIMAAAGIAGTILPWRDVLHDGPVPGGLDLDELAEVRAAFLDQPGMAGRAEILQSFRERDQILQGAADFDAVTLWFEHDLYDQLQILQLLHWFSGADLKHTRLSLICIDTFPGIEPFYGLGQLEPAQMASLAGSATEITAPQLELGRRGWLAFTSDTPAALFELLNCDLSVLPFLRAALIRHLEEFPDTRSGLSRHERQILEMVNAGIHQPIPLFTGQQQREAAPYLGDWSFWNLIDQLSNNPNALLLIRTGAPFVHPPAVPADAAFRSQALELSAAGRAVLRGDADWVVLNPPDKWKGGIHLHPDKTIWRWHAQRQTLRETR